MALTHQRGCWWSCCLQAQPAALGLLRPCRDLVIGYRGYAAQAQGQARLESLYRFTSQVGRSDRPTPSPVGAAQDRYKLSAGRRNW